MTNTAAGIACIGAAHIDRIARCRGEFVMGASNPVTVGASSGGVARNVALNLARLGRHAKLVSVVGGDEAGRGLVAELQTGGVDCGDIAELNGRATASYTAVLDKAGELICGLADADIYDALTPDRLRAVMPGLAAWPLWAIDANLPQETIGALAEAKPEGVRLAGLAVSPAKAVRLAPHLGLFDMLFANRAEASALTGEADALAAAAALQARGPELVCVTLGAEGVAVAAEAGGETYPAPETTPTNVNGAGDAFAAAMLDGLMAGAPLGRAVARGLSAAGLTAASPETCTCDLSRLPPSATLCN